MPIEEWIKLIGVIMGIIGSFIAIHTSFKRKRKQQKKEHDDLLLKLDSLEVRINERLDLLDEKIDEVALSRNRDERDRLRESILQFADRLRLKSNLDELNAGTYFIDSNEFDIMFQNHRKYKDLGGNGYIDEEMKFIAKEFKKIKKGLKGD